MEQKFSAFGALDGYLISDSIGIDGVPVFCTEDNIDQCIAFISQEFCNLGLPSIVKTSSLSSCPLNCDIATLINITSELLFSHRSSQELRSELSERNALLSSDLAVARNNLSQAKSAVERNERKCGGLEERVRQLTEKHKELECQFRNQREENRRLRLSIQQQKSAFQHELKKCERQNSQLKEKLQQLVADKNSDRKCATIDVLNNLPRKNQQRGKWKTNTSAQSDLEDLYSSVMNNYDVRCQKQLKELMSLQSCFKFLQEEISAVSSLLKIDEGDCSVVNQKECVDNKTQDMLVKQFLMIKESIKSLLEFREGAESNTGESENQYEHTVSGLLNNHKEKGEEPKEPVNLRTENEQIASERQKLIEAAEAIKKERKALEDEKLQFLSLTVQTQARCTDSDNSSLFIPSMPILTSTSGVATAPNDQVFTSYIEDVQSYPCILPKWAQIDHSEDNQQDSTSVDVE